MALTKADMAERLFEEVGLNKREAKELVEGAPKPILEGVDKEAAESAKETLEGVGATIELQ
jgi:large subunit ribosomal protein L7/L12